MLARAISPLVAAALGLAGALSATLSLHRAAVTAVDRVLEERLGGAGESTASLIAGAEPTAARLRALMQANGLEDAYLLNRSLRLVAGASGSSGRRADLLRLDARRINQAFAGVASVAPGYTFGALSVLTGYFPVRTGDGGPVGNVLVLEAGRSYIGAYRGITRARNIGVSLSILSALALALAAARWTAVERERRLAAASAARGESLSRVAAMAAHEIRNPLGVIRGTVDLMRERSGATLGERDLTALGDIADEVDRMRRLTQDLLDLSTDRPLAMAPTDLNDLLDEAARTAEAAAPGIKVQRMFAALPPIEADAARLRQVFANLLGNAAQAQRAGNVFLRGQARGRTIQITVQDQGPGIPDEIKDRLFDLYFTTKSGGTGLGLAVARRLVERHGGTLVHDPHRGPGATFEVRLPLRPRGDGNLAGG